MQKAREKETNHDFVRDTKLKELELKENVQGVKIFLFFCIFTKLFIFKC